jgi:hypothetical protein
VSRSHGSAREGGACATMHTHAHTPPVTHCADAHEHTHVTPGTARYLYATVDRRCSYRRPLVTRDARTKGAHACQGHVSLATAPDCPHYCTSRPQRVAHSAPGAVCLTPPPMNTLDASPALSGDGDRFTRADTVAHNSLTSPHMRAGAVASVTHTPLCTVQCWQLLQECDEACLWPSRPGEAYD